MKHRLFCLFLSLLLALLPVSAGASPDLFRLQVIAHSDSPADQQIKLQVRDEILRLSQSLFGSAESAEEACLLAQQHAGAFREAAEAIADRPVMIETGTFDFPDRIYGGVRVPAGAYEALRVTIGRGRGHNWWCVLYPTLCAIDETQNSGDGTVTFYSQTLRLLEKMFGGDER